MRITPRTAAPLALAAALSLAAPAHAASSWICTFGFWDSDDCWSPFGVPGSGVDVSLSRVGGVETILVFDDITGSRQARKLLVSASPNGANVSFEQWGGSLSTVETQIGSPGRQGRYLQTGGEHLVSTTLTVGGFPGQAVYDLRAGSLSTQNSFLGLGGDAIFLQSGGVHSGETLFMTGATTTYQMSGGTLEMASGVSVTAAAWFIHEAGSVDATYLGVGSESSVGGIYSMNVGAAAKTLNTHTLQVARGGTLQQGFGATVSSQILRVGDGAGHSRYWADGGTLTAHAMVVGGSADGTLHHGSGAITQVDDLSFGEAAAAHGELLLWGDSSLTASRVVVGQAGTARVLHAQGVFRVNESMLIGAGGVYDLVQNGRLEASGSAVVVNHGSFNHTGGRFVGTLHNHGAFLLDDRSEGGTAGTAPEFAGHLVNHGTVSLGGSASFSDGLRNEGHLDLLPSGRTLTLNGQGLANNGHFVLSGGTLQGNAAFVNSGEFSGHGRVTGLEINNLGHVQQRNGTLALAPSSGTVFNLGSWQLEAGRELKLDGSHVVFDNQGSMALAGGRVSGNGQLLNRGVLSGSGIVSSAFHNSGTLAIGAGEQFTRTGSFTSDGLIELRGSSALLSASTVRNQGLLAGHGRVMSRLVNEPAGRVVAEGGVLTLGDRVDNAGLMAAEAGGTLLLSTGLMAQTGSLQLNGGTIDLNGTHLRNDGLISGHGTLRAHSIDNAGRLWFSTGHAHVEGAVSHLAGAQIVVSGGGSATFQGAVTARAGSEIRVSEGSVAVFFGQVVQASGALFSGTGTRYFEGGLTVGDAPARGGAEGHVVLGSTSLYRAEIGGLEAGVGFDQFVVGGTLSFGGTLQLVAWEGFEPEAGQRFDLFDWGSASGAFSAFDFGAAPLADGLLWDTSQLYVDGSLGVVAVPEPHSWALMALGLAALGARGRPRPPTAAARARHPQP